MIFKYTGEACILCRLFFCALLAGLGYRGKAGLLQNWFEQFVLRSSKNKSVAVDFFVLADKMEM